MSQFVTLLKKEVRLYFLGNSFFLVSSILSTGLFLLFRFTYPPEKINVDIAVSVLWSVHMISSLFSLIASQEWDLDSGALRAIKLSGVEGYVVFAAKSMASLLSIFLLWILETVVWIILFGSDSVQREMQTLLPVQMVTALSQILLTGFIASAGISFLGQITSVLALHSRFRHVLMFIIFFPVAIPALIAASAYTRYAMTFKGWSSGFNYLSLESAFALFFLAAGILLYDFLWEE